jgi:hypothetical protein
LFNGKAYKPNFKSSLEMSQLTSKAAKFRGSQEDVYHELTGHHQFSGGGGTLAVPEPDHHYQLSYDLAMDNILTPFAGPNPSVQSSLVSNKNK